MAKGATSDSSKVWTVFSLLAAFSAAKLARKGLDTGWRAATGKKPPANPADPDVELREAVAWAVASGTLVGLMRMFALRRAANYYRRSTGELPPPLRTDEQEAAKV